jgi:AraC-like DNA-binding protein
MSNIRRTLLKSDSITAPSLTDVVREYLLPVIEAEGIGCLTLAQSSASAMLPAKGVEVLPRKRRGRAISMRESKQVVAQWPDDHQVALSLPYGCFVFAGEADFCIGDAVVRCPQNRGVLIPPGTPISDGSRPHWERAHLERAYSDVLWMKFHPFGLECHTCHTRGRTHYGGGFGERNFIADRQFFTLAEMLLDELLYRRSGFEVLGQAYLLGLVTLLQRHLEEHGALPQQAFSYTSEEGAGIASSEPELTVWRAKQYIQNNLGKSFTLQEVAHATYASRSKLAALFREQTGQTLWEYVTALRMQEAKVMLAETEITIENIGRLMGFPNSSHFATRFSRYAGVSPSAYRAQNRRRDTRGSGRRSPRNSPRN